MKQYSLTALEQANFSLHEETHLKALRSTLKEDYHKATGELKERLKRVMDRVVIEIVKRIHAA